MSTYLLAARPETDGPPVQEIVTGVGDRIVTAGGATAELMPGQTVQLVPVGFHVVRAKETMWSISRKYGVTADQLKKWNPKVVPTAMKVGTLLRVVSP